MTRMKTLGLASSGIAPNPRTMETSARVLAMMKAARFHGVELHAKDLGALTGEEMAPGTLSQWARASGLRSRAARLTWRQLMRLREAGPVVLLTEDGKAALMVGADPRRNVVHLEDPRAPAGAGRVAVDELRLMQMWKGTVVLVQADRGAAATDAPFTLTWLAKLVLGERSALRDIGIASITISILTVFPPLIVMSVVNRVLEFRSMSTLFLLSMLILTVTVYEAFLSHARRIVIAIVGTRLDTRLGLHIFNRLLRLPIEYYERHPAGETMYRTMQVGKIREFLTGKLLATLLDLVTLAVLLPLLFYLNATLAWIVVACAVCVLAILVAFLRPLRAIFLHVTNAETLKSAALGETIFGIKTVKALALEPQRRDLWDLRVAEASRWRLAFMRLSNWPQTLVLPFERMMGMGTILLGAYLAINDPSGYMVGSLFAFMMLSQRVAAPLVGIARLTEDFEEVGSAIGEIASVINRPMEDHTATSGTRPQLSGAISFQDVTFAYPGTTTPALEDVAFDIPAGSVLGIVGRSGSGKSTVTRLLQGINREFRGQIKLDGTDLRDMNLRHLRQSFGVVLQDNFLFRGSIRENIIAGRQGLTLADAIRAARLAGAEEFIERLPQGFDTYIEEGSPNLSGGQKQRLAIARALISDPRILILDEATSALDPESEAVVTANLQRIASGRTMIIVSHRLSTLTGCDNILVLERGRVADIAPHPTLLERCTIYRQLWQQQNRHMSAEGSRAAPAPVLIKR